MVNGVKKKMIERIGSYHYFDTADAMYPTLLDAILLHDTTIETGLTANGNYTHMKALHEFHDPLLRLLPLSLPNLSRITSLDSRDAPSRAA